MKIGKNIKIRFQKKMHKLEEIYQNEQFIDDIEINLFEPECIITDSTKDEIPSFIVDGDSAELASAVSLELRNNLNVPITNLRDCLTIRRINLPVPASHENETGEVNINGNNLPTDAFPDITFNPYLQDLEMHSIFTPDKRYKAKEIFTQCNFCGKFVISRMCPETGIYSKCKYCFNSPFSVNNTIFESSITPEDDVLPLPIEPEISIKTDNKFSRNFLTTETVSHSKSDGAFKCDHCGKLFTRNWYLKQHIKLHSNEKPFGCDLCDKRFLNSSNLKQHMKTHSIEYRCSVCNKTYINQTSLDEHMLRHEESAKTEECQNPVQTSCVLQCNYCSQKFTDEVRLKEHLRSHTKESPYHCDQCEKSFRYNNSLTKHKKLHEGAENSSTALNPPSKACANSQN